SHLVNRLVTDKWQVTVLDLYERRYDNIPDSVRFIRGDLSQAYLIREALIGIDVVFHLAWATIHEVANQDPSADVNANLIPSLQLIETAHQAKVKRFVFPSSGGTVYGPVKTLPIHETYPKRPINAYGVTKLAFEKYLHMYHHLHGFDYAVVRPSVPYGPYQNPLGRQGAPAIFMHRIVNEQPIAIWGDGRISRDYFYVSDLVDAFVACGTEPLGEHRVFNIGGAEEVSLLDLIEAIEQIVGKKAIINFHPARDFDAPRIVLDTGRAREYLSWTPQVNLHDGLERTWAWMSKNVD
ncbi:MAG: NAD-dependent epimerase/dehydratase family protein, partial [Chloroflexi bacterium]|nr:NAD-dependent epimerase/dehydratase family protein [Chloroflexota bacterium]